MGLYEQHYLKHYGVKGMKWGVRRYQNEDGTLTALGKERYYTEDEQRKTYERARNFVVKEGYGNSLKITGDKDLEDAASFLKEQSKIVHRKYSEYAESCATDIDDMPNKRDFINEVKKRLDRDFGSPYQVDDPEFLWIDAWDTIDDIVESGKFESQQTKQARQNLAESVEQYRSNLKTVADSIVGKYGNQPVSYVEKGFLSRKKITSTYKDAVNNTLYDLGGGLTMRHLLRGDFYVDNGEWLDSITDAVVDEWKNSK